MAIFFSWRRKTLYKDKENWSKNLGGFLNWMLASVACQSLSQISWKNCWAPRILNVLVKCYDHELRTLLNQHAPEKTKTVTRHSNTPWYNDELRMAKREKRRAERFMRETGLVVHKEIFKSKSLESWRLLLSAKENYFSEKIAEIGTDQKQLYKITNNLLGKDCGPIFPTRDNKEEMANEFGRFFIGKISTIRDQLAISKENLGLGELSADMIFLDNH